MTRPNRIESIEDIKIWIADHDGRIDAWWVQQHSWNKSMEGNTRSCETRLTALEKKVMYFSGASAAFGSVIGALIANAL